MKKFIIKGIALCYLGILSSQLHATSKNNAQKLFEVLRKEVCNSRFQKNDTDAIVTCLSEAQKTYAQGQGQRKCHNYSITEKTYQVQDMKMKAESVSVRFSRAKTTYLHPKFQRNNSSFWKKGSCLFSRIMRSITRVVA